MPEQAETEFADEVTEATGNNGGIKRRGNVDNLRMWQPGQSGNPNGRPRRKPITEELEKLLEEIDPTDKKHRRTFKKRIVEALAFQIIKKGNVAAFTEIADRIEGKVAQRQEHTGVDGGPVVFESLGSRQEVEQKIAIILMQAGERKSEAVTTSQPMTIEGAVTIEQTPQSVTTSQPVPVGEIYLDPITGSSNVASAGYDPVGCVLTVKYKSGAQYIWRRIPPEEYEGLRSAESPGRYMQGIEARYGVGVKIEQCEIVTARAKPKVAKIDLDWN